MECRGIICSKIGWHLHCSLCNENSFATKHLYRRHVKQVHFSEKHFIIFGDIVCLPCKKAEHLESNSSKKLYHYHCPLCCYVVCSNYHAKSKIPDSLIKTQSKR